MMFKGFDMDINFDASGYSLNLDLIAKSKDMLAVTRLLAADLMDHGYVNVGDFVKELTDRDLLSLTEQIETDDDGEMPNCQDMILVAEMLATGEGCDAAKDADVITARLNQLAVFLTCESLARKGFVRVFHENLSFHEDMKDKMVVEKI
jgi:hypothetical protein